MINIDMKRLNNIRPITVLCGLIVVIGLLASICAVIPKEGIAVSDSVTLRFPSLSEVLEGDSADIGMEQQLTPEQLLALREQEMKMQEEQQYIDFFTTNPVRIHFPQNDFTYLDNVYTALDSAAERSVRIVHFGDSQLEDDRISCNLRLALQSQFGGGGNGLIPLQESLYSQTINIGSKHTPKRYQIYGPKSNRRDSSTLYGPMGNVTVLDTTMHLAISPKKKNGSLTVTHYFNRLRVLSGSGDVITFSAQNQMVKITPANTPLQFTTIPLRDSTTNISLTLSGNADIYGIMLDTETGVGVDNIPMRGCSGTVFTGINPTQLRAYFAETNTRLIIMQFGGNSMPYLKDRKGVDRYMEQLRRQIRYLQRLAPEAKLLWVGPSDMTTRINGKLQTYPMLAAVDASLCHMVNEEGCAYWSLFESMGGNGSMVRWANSQPPLAGKDYIHFTRLGAQRAGELLTEAFMTGYRYYKFRNPEPEIETEPTDSIENNQIIPDSIEETQISSDSLENKPTIAE